jgi:hypothetical protein
MVPLPPRKHNLTVSQIDFCIKTKFEVNTKYNNSELQEIMRKYTIETYTPFPV